MKTTERIAVLGAGSWGTTLALLLAGRNHDVTLWSHRDGQVDEITRTRGNAHYLPGIRIPDAIYVTGDIARALAGAGIVVVAVPSHTVRTVVARAAAEMPARALFVSTSKGLEEHSMLRMSQVITQAAGKRANAVVALLGPSHAEEVSRGMPTSTVAASNDPESARRVQNIFSTPTFRAYTNDDLVGVELATALKNVIAIAAGIVDGIGYGDNTKAALITRGLAEIARLGVALGARRDTFSGLAGVGDLVVTCLSQHSRNRRVGESIGRGQSLVEAESAAGMVAEGVRTTRVVRDLAAKEGIDMPIASTVYSVLFHGADPRESVTALMTRPLRSEATPDERAERR